jgi:hypothetical protein
MITQLLTAAHLASIMVVLRLSFGARRMAPRPATSDARRTRARARSHAKEGVEQVAIERDGGRARSWAVTAS